MLNSEIAKIESTKIVVIGRKLSYNKKKYAVGEVLDTLVPAHARALVFMRCASYWNEAEVAVDNFERNLREEFKKVASQPKAEEPIDEPEAEEIDEPEALEAKPMTTETAPIEKPKTKAQLRKEMLARQIADD